MSRFLSFPDLVNEVAVRVTAAGVAILAVLAVTMHTAALLAVLAYGFVARALAGPRVSPLALVASRVIAPRIARPRLIAGPPKRFAQSLGAVVSVTAALLYFAAGLHAAAYALVAVIALLATLESAFGICVGCVIHARLARRGVIAADECADCADVRGRLRAVR